MEAQMFEQALLYVLRKCTCVNSRLLSRVFGLRLLLDHLCWSCLCWDYGKMFWIIMKLFGHYMLIFEVKMCMSCFTLRQFTYIKWFCSFLRNLFHFRCCFVQDHSCVCKWISWKCIGMITFHGVCFFSVQNITTLSCILPYFAYQSDVKQMVQTSPFMPVV